MSVPSHSPAPGSKDKNQPVTDHRESSVAHRKKKSVWPWVLALLLLGLLIWGGCALLGGKNTESVRVDLKTTTTSTGTTNYGPDDSIVTEDFEGDWTKPVADIRPQDGYNLRAKSDDASATVTCEISVDGAVQSQASATDGKEASCELPEDIKK